MVVIVSPSHLTSPSVPWYYTCFWLSAWQSSLNFNSDNLLDIISSSLGTPTLTTRLFLEPFKWLVVIAHRGHFSTSCGLALFLVSHVEWGAEREKDPGDEPWSSTWAKWAMVSYVISLRVFNISSGKQKKLYKGSQGEDGTLIKVSCFLSSFLPSFPFPFFQLFWMLLRARKLKYKSEHSNFIFFLACSIFCHLSCCCFLLPQSLRAGNVFGFHQDKTGKEWMRKLIYKFSLCPVFEVRHGPML